MLNELYTFAEPVQVVPFSSLKWGKFTLLHTKGTSFNNEVQNRYKTDQNPSKAKLIQYHTI